MKKAFFPTTSWKEIILSNLNATPFKIRTSYFRMVVGLVLLSFSSTAQVDTNSMWTWVSGDSIANQAGVYGTQGIPSQGNKPGSRQYSVSWIDQDGNLWLMGGASFEGGVWGTLNDLWKYNLVANQWTWVNGDNTRDQLGVYGTKGITSKDNKPGARQGAISWTDKDGKFWLMGGLGNAANGGGSLNDLWKYDPETNEWTWIKGENAGWPVGVYGTKGISHANNNPGGRYGAVSWTGSDGKLWMMGGFGFATNNQQQGHLNDLWRYDPVTNDWTWISGDSALDKTGIYGTKGIPAENNKPGSRFKPFSWTDSYGKLWLMGGVGFSSNSIGNLNDLWKFDPVSNVWTWVNGDNTPSPSGIYGTQGISDTRNKPGGRHGAVTWTGTDGNLWLIGGAATYDNGLPYWYNDLWKYNPVKNEWTWVNGDNIINQASVFGTRGESAAANKPGARHGSIGWTGPDGKLWLMSGLAHEANGHGDLLNDLWKYNPAINEWTWMKGDSTINVPGVYGAQGVTSNGNFPGARMGAFNWIGMDGKLWLMGGSGKASNDGGLLNDLWEYDPNLNEWIWVNGDKTINQFGIYGTKGVASINNKPGARRSAICWTGKDGNFWLMGGNGFAATEYGSLNDLWKYDPVTNQWTWMKGDYAINQPGIYGAKGITSQINKPGARDGGLAWTDSKGKLWIMGGTGIASSEFGYLNDLWNYDPITNSWTWINGNNSINQTGVYGSQGISSANNQPGGRSEAVSWLGNDGNFWLMGGQGFANTESGSLNDLWKYEPVNNQWTWVKGDSIINKSGIYGIKGIANVDNKPGARYGSVSWIDQNDKLWLMGGYFNFARLKISGFLNELWSYDIKADQWCWVKGDKEINQDGIYGTMGIPAVSNKPGARFGSVGWTGIDGKFWYMGGRGYSAIYLNDLWKLTPTENTYYKDADGDGYGNADVSMKANYVPAGYVLKTGDCNDNNAAVHPGAEEICDGLDNNCDGRVDEGCPPVSKTKVFVKDIIVIEGNEGYRNAIFPVWLNGKSTTPVTIKYQTVDSSATSPEDYKSTSGTICFSPNSLFQVVTVKVRGDRTMEPNEKFRLVLYAPVNAVLPDSSATCTIINDDKKPSVQIHDATATEKSGLAMVKVSMKEECGQEVRVKYYTKDKSARSPEDYIGIFNGELIFYPGEKEKFIKVTIVKDNLKEKTEEFEVRLKDDEHGNRYDDKDCRDVAEVKIINSSSNDNGHPGASGKYGGMPELPSELQVRVLPNPSQNGFQVNLASNGKGAIQLRVSDMQGRVVENRKIEGTMQQISLGERWSHGNYILQVIQGDEMKTVQLIKLK